MMKRIMLQLAAVVLSAVLLSCAGSQSFQRGERYADQGDWDLAVKEYREAIKRNPQDIEYRSALIRAEETGSNQHYKRARDFLKEHKIDQAIIELQQALYLNPSNAAVQSALKSALNIKQADDHYRAALTLIDLNKLGGAIHEMNQAVELDPDNLKYRDELNALQKKRIEAEPQDVLSLASDKPITLNFKNTNIKDVFEFLSKLSGINILFDEEVKAQPVTVFVKDVSFQDALNLLLSTNKLFMKKISNDTIIIIPRSKSKVDQYQDLEIKTFYINNAKAKDITNVLRSMLDIKKLYENETLNSITIRDTPEKLKLAEKIIAANDLKEAEIILDVEVLEISRDNELTYGWNLNPGLTATASIQPPPNQVTTTSAGIALSQLTHLNGDSIFVTLPSLVVNLLKSDSNAQTLANPRVRVMNKQSVKFHIGDKIPVQTSTIQSTATVAVTSTFEYKDVGIKLVIDPTIHLNNTITLKLGLEVASLGSPLTFGNGQTQYEFGTRNEDTIVTLRDGEAVIIGGLIGDTESKSVNKIPILGDIPFLGKLFSNTSSSKTKDDIIMSITPNIVRNMELPDKDVQRFWSGTEEQYDVKPLFVAETGKSSKAGESPYNKAELMDALAMRQSAAGAAAPQAPASAPALTGAAAPQAPVSAPTLTGAAAPQAPASAPTLTAVAATQVPVPPIPAAGGQLSPGGAVALTMMNPPEITSPIAKDIQFDIATGMIKGIYGAMLTFSYDPQIVEFKSAGEGTLLKKDGQQTSFLFSNNAKEGTVNIYMIRVGNVGGVDGPGTLCSLLFRGKARGTSEVAMKSVRLLGANRQLLHTDEKGARIIVK